MALTISLVALVVPSAAWTDAPTSGLVAAYAFDEGSGGVVTDASGNGHSGTISGATWAAGRYGNALSFNGSNASVLLDSLGTFYNGGFTLEAWVHKQTSKNDVAVVGTWTGGGGPMLWVDHLATRYHLTLGNSSINDYLNSGHSPVVGQWQHLAATYDGTTARFYIDGAEVASRAFSGSVGASNSWRIGAYGSGPGGFFDGLIDNVRIYNRALAAGEIQTNMIEPVAPGSPLDTTPPGAPGTLTATGGPGQVSLAWGAATDDVGVTRYNVHRSASAGFTPSAANRIAQPAGTSYTNTGLAAGTYYYKVTAEDAAGNIGPASNEASATVAGDATPPTVALTAPTAGAMLTGPVTVTAAASDGEGVAGVQFRLDGQNLGAEDTGSPYSIVWDTRGELNGAHSLRAVARDAAGNTTTSAAVPVTVSNPGVSAAGLRVAYGFDDGAGSSALDSSGNNRTATLVGAGWTTGGRFGGAVSLNGQASEVDPPSLGTFYKTAFTYEAWVRKQSSKTDVGLLGSWVGGQSGGPMIWVDHINGRYRLTLGTTFGNYLDSGRVPAVGQWQHVAATYDGTVARIYIDGVETASSSFTGNVGDSNTWRIGAYGAPAGGFFDGLVDNVRVYDRALPASEIAGEHGVAHSAREQSADGDGEESCKRRGRGQRRGHRDRHLQRAHEREHDHELDVPAQGRGERLRAKDRDLQLGDEHRDTDAAEPAAVRRHLHPHRQGWQ